MEILKVKIVLFLPEQTQRSSGIPLCMKEGIF
jgi:hypothetical protein